MATGVNVKMGVEGISQFKNNMNQARQAVKTLDAQLALSEKQFKASGDAESYMTEKTELLKAKLEQQKTVAEGAGAVSVAACMFRKVDITAGKTVCVVSGGNIDVTTVSRVITKGLTKAGRLVEIATKVEDKPGHLLRMLTLVRDTGANIVTIDHNREDRRSDVGACVVSMILETRNAAHVAELREKLCAAGYPLL
jgi:threonine dehydratase